MLTLAVRPMETYRRGIPGCALLAETVTHLRARLTPFLGSGLINCQKNKKGDEFITSLSRIFSKHFRSSDIFRIGGDEFVFLCQNIAQDMFHKKIRNMRIECERKHPGALSLGALWEASPSNLEAMIREGDRRMYQEKRRSKAAAVV